MEVLDRLVGDYNQKGSNLELMAGIVLRHQNSESVLRLCDKHRKQAFHFGRVLQHAIERRLDQLLLGLHTPPAIGPHLAHGAVDADGEIQIAIQIAPKNSALYGVRVRSAQE
jgi:hypothetical protein